MAEATYTVEQAKRIVRETYPQARCCTEGYWGYGVYAGKEEDAERLTSSVIPGMSKREAWKSAAAFVSKSEAWKDAAAAFVLDRETRKGTK
jgi:hypothetical protein